MKRTMLTALGLVMLVGGCGIAGSVGPDSTSTRVAALGASEPAIAEEILSPNHDVRENGAVTAIVLHHTAVIRDAWSTAHFFEDPKSKVSAHYIVDRNGAILRCVPDNLKAWHAGVSAYHGHSNVNEFSVGIEICNVGDGVEPYPKAQVDAVVRLVAWLSVKHKVDLANVTRHRDVALPAGRKNDTSDNFDQAYVTKAAGALIAGGRVAPWRPNVPPAGYDPSRQTYVVQPGDTAESISENHYDSPALAGAILRLNGLTPLTPGRTIRLPVSY